MRIKILRGVCVGVADYAEPGQVRDVDDATADYLKNIGAAEDAPRDVEAPPPAGPTEAESQAAAAAAAAGKDAAPEGGKAADAPAA